MALDGTIHIIAGGDNLRNRKNMAISHTFDTSERSVTVNMEIQDKASFSPFNASVIVVDGTIYVFGGCSEWYTLEMLSAYIK